MAVILNVSSKNFDVGSFFLKTAIAILLLSVKMTGKKNTPLDNSFALANSRLTINYDCIKYTQIFTGLCHLLNIRAKLYKNLFKNLVSD